jgi:hypothetical protein
MQNILIPIPHMLDDQHVSILPGYLSEFHLTTLPVSGYTPALNCVMNSEQ